MIIAENFQHQVSFVEISKAEAKNAIEFLGNYKDDRIVKIYNITLESQNEDIKNVAKEYGVKYNFNVFSNIDIIKFDYDVNIEKLKSFNDYINVGSLTDNMNDEINDIIIKLENEL